MGYILIEESLFKKMTSRWLSKEEVVMEDFSETDYWMSGKEVCKYLNISNAILCAYRSEKILFYCRIKSIYHYKRGEVYKLKAQMNKELVESGFLLGECTVIDNEEQAYTVTGKDNKGIRTGVRDD